MARPPGQVAVPSIDPTDQKILVIYLFKAMGDALLLGPAIQALAAKGPRSITLLLPSGAARVWKLYDREALNVKLVTLPDSLYLPEGDSAWDEVQDEADAFEEKLRKKKFDLAIDLTLRDSVDSRRWLELAEQRLGFIRGDESAQTLDMFWAAPDERYQAERHWSRYLVQPMAPLAVTAPDYEVPLIQDDKAREKAEGLFGEAPKVLMIPGAASTEKRWGEDQFASLGRAVAQRGGSVVVSGTSEEGPLIRAVVKAIGASAKPFTSKSLPALLELVRAADVVVSNDTGPMHLAYLLNIKTLAIFTHMSPICWGPPVRSPRFVVLNAPRSTEETKDAQDIWARAALHHLETLLCAP